MKTNIKNLKRNIENNILNLFVPKISSDIYLNLKSSKLFNLIFLEKLFANIDSMK